MRRMKDKIEATVTNADYATSAGSASKATNADSATKATTADKLGTSAGTTTQPVYFKDGKPTVIGYTIAKSVPADAKFTDTNTWRGIQNNLTSDSTDQSLSAAQGKALKGLVDGKADKEHTHNSIKDAGDNRTLTFAYSKDGLPYGNYSWLAAWNGNELRAVDKKQFATAGHSHAYIPSAGGDVTNYLNFNQTSTGIAWTCANGDVYHLRPYSPNNVFQLTRQNPNSKIGEYGVLNITGDGDIFFGRPGWADAFPMFGTVATGSNYIRFGNGTQICWGQTNSGDKTQFIATFGAPFSNANYAVVCDGIGVRESKSTTSCTFDYVDKTFANGNYGREWVAIGRWK